MGLTKINTEKQLRKGDADTFLKSTNIGVKWSPINFTTQDEVNKLIDGKSENLVTKEQLDQAKQEIKTSHTELDTTVKQNTQKIKELETNNNGESARIQQAISTAIADVNTAKFVGPLGNISELSVDSVDNNDLVLVGTKAPYTIYAKIQGEMKQIGATSVDLSGYVEKTELDNIKENIADTAKEKITQELSDRISSIDSVAKSARRTAEDKLRTVELRTYSGVTDVTTSIPSVSVSLNKSISSYKEENVDVYMNGVYKIKGHDYSKITIFGNQANIVFTENAEVGDRVVVLVRDIESSK